MLPDRQLRDCKKQRDANGVGWRHFLIMFYHFASESSTDSLVSVCSTSEFLPGFTSEARGFVSGETPWTASGGSFGDSEVVKADCDMSSRSMVYTQSEDISGER